MNYLETHLAIVKHLVEHTFKRTYKTNSIEDVLWDVVSNCARLLELEDCVIYLFDIEKHVFIQKAAYGTKLEGDGVVKDPVYLQLGEGIAGYVGKSGVAELISDCTKDPRYIVDDIPRNSEIAVPLIFEGKVIGVIDSEHSEKDFFKSEHLDIMQSISSICAIKIAEMHAHKENEVLARFFNEATHPALRLDYSGLVINKNKAADSVLNKWKIVDSRIYDQNILNIIRSVITQNKEHVLEMIINGETFSLNFIAIVGRQYVNVYSSNITDLKRAKLEAEEANKIKDKFLSVISHEIRTPLNAIVGTLNLLKADGLNNTQKDYLETTDFASEKLLSLLNNILDVEKIEANKMQIDKVYFNLGNLLSNLKKTFAFETQSKRNTIEFNIGDSANNNFYGDETKIFQVLINLLNNAIKFTDQGSIAVNVHKESQTESRSRFRFEVSDTGIGIPKDKLDSIFMPFHQAESSISRRFGGTGLGLSIAKSIVDMLDGEITVNSIEGEGTTFVVLLDLIESEDQQSLKIKEQINFDSNALKDIIILLVDDNKINLKIGEQFLKKWGATIIMAENGNEAVEVFKEQDIDLILMDIHMPICDGFEATKKIRTSNLSNHNIPILAITADVTTKSKELALLAGVNDIIEKPFKPEGFISTIQSSLNKEIIKIKAK